MFWVGGYLWIFWTDWKEYRQKARLFVGVIGYRYINPKNDYRDIRYIRGRIRGQMLVGNIMNEW